MNVILGLAFLALDIFMGFGLCTTHSRSLLVLTIELGCLSRLSVKACSESAGAQFLRIRRTE